MNDRFAALANEPVAVAAAVGAVLSALATAVLLFVPDFTAEQRLALVSVVDALIGLVIVVIARPRTTPVANPTLPQGTVVNVVTPGDAPNYVTTLDPP